MAHGRWRGRAGYPAPAPQGAPSVHEPRGGRGERLRHSRDGAPRPLLEEEAVRVESLVGVRQDALARDDMAAELEEEPCAITSERAPPWSPGDADIDGSHLADERVVVAASAPVDRVLQQRA